MSECTERSAFGGVDVHRLAARVGSTPFFVYDRGAVGARVAAVRAALPAGLELSYAVKANPMPALLHHLRGLVDGFDVASAQELRHALDTGMAPERVSFAGPGKSDAELRQAVAAGVTVELESEGEITRVLAASEGVGMAARVAIRVNPDFAVRGAGLRMGGGAAQFGIDAERVPAVLGDLGRCGLDFLGLHVFSGSQNLQAEGLCEAQRQTVAMAVRLAAFAPGPVSYLNLGGGFGIPYSRRDRPLDLARVGANLGELLDGILARELPQARVVVELGRYLVGEAGAYVTRVVDRKASRGTTYLVVDGGLHHQLAAAGLLGQVVRRNYPMTLVPRSAAPLAPRNTATAGPTETVTVVGCLCTPLDLLGDAVDLPAAQVGDLVMVFQAGAYGLTASPTGFLSHPVPVEILL